MSIDLPRHTNSGKPKISYSQIGMWNDDNAFSQIIDSEGKYKTIKNYEAYVLKYMLNFEFPPQASDIYAPFGSKIEDYICKREKSDLDIEEIAVLDTITPLGHFQKELNIDFGEFVLNGFIDDTNKESQDVKHPLYLSHIRDYKTASASSSKKYYKPEYDQLDTYALELWMSTKKLPKKMEVCIIERSGSHFKPPLKVAGNVWYVDRPISEDRLMVVKNKIINTVRQISDVYKIYKQINGIK